MFCIIEMANKTTLTHTHSHNTQHTNKMTLTFFLGEKTKIKKT